MSDFEPIIGRYLPVDIDGATYRVHVEEAGQGVPLLCLHTATGARKPNGVRTSSFGATISVIRPFSTFTA